LVIRGFRIPEMIREGVNYLPEQVAALNLNLHMLDLKN